MLIFLATVFGTLSAMFRSRAALEWKNLAVPRQNHVGPEINSLQDFLNPAICYHYCPCSASSACLWGLLTRFLRSRHSLLLENLALRQQLTALKRKYPKPRLRTIDKLFWVLALRFWPAWKRCLLIVTPETVVRWHRAGSRLYWSLISKVRKCGRKRIAKQVRELIFRMVEENSTWGAPRIQGELLKLGFQISERTVSRWMKRVPRNPDPARRWLAFLRNHREAIASRDFLTVPTFTFGILYCFFVVAHDVAA
jgi:hypothetical protein